MHARFVASEALPGKLDEFVRLFKDEFVGALKEDQGFQSVYVFTNRDTNRFVAFAIYESEADVAASDAGFRQRAAKAADLLATRPAAETYELSVQG